MKKIKLLSMKLSHFKGIKQLNIDFNGANARIYGENGTGKTSIFDALTWILFDKDSANKKDFGIKTLANGEVVHNLEHSVEIILSVDGTTTKLKKVFSEVWKKKRGESEKTLEKDTTAYYINDVPIKTQREYKQFIESIVDEETFKLITSPVHFAQMDWKKQRARLFAIAGTVTDEEVIDSNPSLFTLPSIIENRTVEQTKEMIERQLREFRKEQELLPKLIHENLSMKPSLSVDIPSLEAKVQGIEKEMEDLKTQRHHVINGAAVLEKQKQLQELDIELSKLKQTFETESMQEIFKLRTRVQEVQGNVQIIQSELSQLQNQKTQKEFQLNTKIQALEILRKKREKLLDDWYEVDSRVLENEHTCPMCKQALPADHIQEALAKFEESKKQKKDEINSEGKLVKEKIEENKQQQTALHDEISYFEAEIEKANDKLENAQKELSKYTTKLEQAQSVIPDITKSEAYQTIIASKQALQTEMQQLNEHTNEVVASMDVSISELNQVKQQVNIELAQVANVAVIEKRVKELEEKQINFGKECEKLERYLDIIETFIRTKVKMLDERINSQFKYVKFKLFKDLKNGGLEECCEILYDGVPYSQGLNNAARINAGLDIINTLSAHHGIQAPIFVDNAEAVTKFIDVKTQLISLVVSEKDKQLRVEIEPIEYKEAI